jgi:DNA-cytosine methyltransferase
MIESAPSPERATRIVHALNAILGKPQEQLAAELGVSFSTLNAWSNGKRKPHAAHLDALDAALAAATGAPPDDEGRLRAALAILHVAYGSPDLGNRPEPLDELFYILLSLKTSHRTYEETFERFREKFHPWDRLLEVGADDIEAHIRRGGLGSLKARAFVDIAARLKEDFGRVSLDDIRSWEPGRIEKYLMSLPGVGLKTARCVMMYSLKLDVVPVDTHTYRVGLRIGLIATAKNPNAAHDAFDRVTPPKLAYALHTNLVAHGRDQCADPTPKCSGCPVAHLCRYREARGEVRVEASTSDGVQSSRGGHLSDDVLRDGRPRAVDIYAGCGGLSMGLELGGFDVAFALDWDKHACLTHEQNFPKTKVHCGNVVDVTGADITAASGGPIALVAGGPNCPGLSERGLRSPDDPRNFMLPEFVRLVEELNPAAFLMENVPGLAHRQNFGMLRTIFETFKRLGYKCAGEVLLAADYGVPQLRYRFFIVGTRADIDITFPKPTHAAVEAGDLLVRPFVTVGAALGDLPSIPASRQKDARMDYAGPNDNLFRHRMREGSDGVWNHTCSATEDINLRRAAEVKEGGNWKDIPPKLLPDRFFACRMTDHSTTYARLRRDMPAFTITALCGNITSGAFTHPTDNRALSIREGARLQSFPDRFRLHGPRNSQYRQVGNAVPPLLGAAVARHLLAILRGERPAGIAPRVTPELLNDPRGGDALPVLTPRFKQLFGQATRWPRGWGPEPKDPATRLNSNYMLLPEFWPEHAKPARRKKSDGGRLETGFAEIG